jgi:hypothetical protein
MACNPPDDPPRVPSKKKMELRDVESKAKLVCKDKSFRDDANDSFICLADFFLFF